MDRSSIARRIMQDAQRSLTNFLEDSKGVDAVGAAAEILVDTFKAKKMVLSFGNGGSMCDAMHFAEELSGRFRRDRPALPAVAVSDPSFLTCAANDFGYDDVFARFVSGFGGTAGAVLAISTSGTSKNVLNAVAAAKQARMKVIGLCGSDKSPLATQSDVAICAPSVDGFADRSQEIHIKVVHSLIELVERELFPDNYAE